MKKLLVCVLLLFALCFAGCDTYMTSLPHKMPEDFSFSLTFDFDGYYDSKSGVLKNGYNYDLNRECETTLIFTEEELQEIYSIFLEGSIDRWEEELTVNKSIPPSYVIEITFTANSQTEKVKIYGASHIGLDEWETGVRLGKAYYRIVDEYIKNTEEYKSLPPNQNWYDW